ncbi:MAG: tagatose 1,6-diphosphate aldolase [Nitratireductor sp.]
MQRSMQQPQNQAMQLSPGKLWGMRRMADMNGRFKMTAVDQRPPIKQPIAAHYGTAEAPWEDVARFKTLLIETLQGESSAMLLDPHYAIPSGLDRLSPAKGLIVTLEDSIFREVDGGGRYSSQIDGWSVGKIKRLGGDAVKVLAWYRPDAPADVLQHQRDFTRRIGEACQRFDIPFLFELLVYPLAQDAEQTRDYVEMASKKADHVLASVAEFAKPEYGVDVFKLESPVAAASVPGVGNEGWEDVQSVFDEMGRLAGRPWVMLSAGAGKPEFRNIMTHAYRAGASGYLAGRAIWLDAFRAFPDWNAIRSGLEGEAVAYMRELNSLTDKEALPFHEHECYAGRGGRFHPRDETFRHVYAGL